MKRIIFLLLSIFLTFKLNSQITEYFKSKQINGEYVSNIADFDNDGYSDFITCDNSKVVRLYLNTKNGFKLSLNFDITTYSSPVIVQDFDLDGKSDILTNSINGRDCSGNQIRIYWNTGKVGQFFNSGNFSELPLAFGDYCIQTYDIDFNLDGYIDLISTSMRGPTRTYKNIGNRNFTIQKDFYWPRDLYGVQIDDFNGDGLKDFISFAKEGWADGSYGSYCYLGNGDGSFQLPITNFSLDPKSNGGFKINADCKLNTISDILVNRKGQKDSQLGIWNNEIGNFSFKTIIIPTGYIPFHGFDFDENGSEDIAIFKQSVPFTISFLPNDGFGNFSQPIKFIESNTVNFSGIHRDLKSKDLYIYGSSSDSLFFLIKKTENSSSFNFNSMKKVIGSTYTLTEIMFDYNSFELNDKSKYIITQFSKYLIENKSMEIIIQGHTDDEGEAVKNEVLSQQRADAVMNYLVQLGVDASRLKAKGYGALRPKVRNTTEQNKAINRRTEFKIVKI